MSASRLSPFRTRQLALDRAARRATPVTSMTLSDLSRHGPSANERVTVDLVG